MEYNEIRTAESGDPIRIVANEPDGELLEAGGSLLEHDAIAKMNAGAMLISALWCLPADVIKGLLDKPGFASAYGRACEAYGVHH